jgi:glycosyltransferase involved in cell wall biosynthesis
MTLAPRLLFVSPVVPAPAGNGLAMRAGAILVALARHYRVTLLVAPIYHPGYASDSPWLEAQVDRVFQLGLPPELDPDETFDVVHVFRLAALPYAEPWLRDMDTTAGQLDLDEAESVSRRGIAALLRRTGDIGAALREERAARQTRAREDEVLNRFDRIFVASEVDREALQGRGRAEIAVLPNSLPLPTITLSPSPSGGPFTLLFVGTLGYPPNADAARFAAEEILPRLRTESERPVILRIVGGGAGTAVRQLDTLPGVEVIGETPDVSPWYRDAHVAIVPLRAGGGTRIKVLEAFARMRPVVTTTIGIAGIAAEPDRHVLVADDAETFAAACLRLMHEPTLAERLASDAFALFSRDYSRESLARIVATFAPPRRSPEFR